MSKKIKILRIMHRINIGGPTYHAAYLTKFLDKEIFETLLISGNINKKEESNIDRRKNDNEDQKEGGKQESASTGVLPEAA